MNRRTVCLTAVFGALSPPSVFAQEGKVTVFAAASMKDALDEINAAFTKSTGIKVDASYADAKRGNVTIKPGFSLAQLAGNGLIAIGDVQEVPVGIYAKEALEKLGSWDAAAAKLTMPQDVRAAR